MLGERQGEVRGGKGGWWSPEGPPGWVLSGGFLGKGRGNGGSKEELGDCGVGSRHSLQGHLVSRPKVKASTVELLKGPELERRVEADGGLPPRADVPGDQRSHG